MVEVMHAGRERRMEQRAGDSVNGWSAFRRQDTVVKDLDFKIIHSVIYLVCFRLCINARSCLCVINSCGMFVDLHFCASKMLTWS